MEEDKKTENIEQSKKVKATKILNTSLKTASNIVYVLLGIIVIILIYNIIQLSILNKPYMDIFGYTFFQVKTGSMSGTIEIGDIILVKLTKEVQENDIVTYKQDQILISSLHN